MTKQAKQSALDSIEQNEEYAYVTNRWSRTIVQPLLIALVTTSVFAAAAVLFDVLARTTLYAALAPMIFLATLEGIYTTIWLRHPSRRQLNHTAYRAAEFLVILLVTRLYLWALTGLFPEPARFADYLRAPYILVNDGPFIAGAILLLLAWQRAIAVSGDFNALAIDRSEAYYFTLPSAEQEPGMKPAYSNRSLIVKGLFQQWIIGGVILAGLVAIIALDPLNFAQGESFFAVRQLDMPPLLVLSLLIYFIGGLLLLSQARLGAKNAVWLHQGIAKEPAIERTWNRYTTWLILAIGFIALFLPLGSTVAIGRILQAIVVTIIGLAALINYLFIALLAFLFSPLARPAENVTPDPVATSLPPTPEPTPIPLSTAPPDETLQLLFSSAFWAVAIVFSGIAIAFFLRDRGVPLNLTLFKALAHTVGAWLKGFWRDVSDYTDDFRQAVRARIRTDPDKHEESKLPPWRFIRINGLSPRDQIRYFYLSTVKRAQERGVERSDAETPLEYADDLKETWPEAETEIEELTDAFLKARYSRKEFDKEEVNPIKAGWQRVKKSLRRKPRA